jgi:hypothetical protein
VLMKRIVGRILQSEKQGPEKEVELLKLSSAQLLFVQLVVVLCSTLCLFRTCI